MPEVTEESFSAQVHEKGQALQVDRANGVT